MNRRSFFAALAGLLVVPGVLIARLRKPACDHHVDKLAFTPGEGGESGYLHCLCGERLPICRDNKHPNWRMGQSYCPDCGMAISVFWKKLGDPTKYKVTHHAEKTSLGVFRWTQFTPESK